VPEIRQWRAGARGQAEPLEDSYLPTGACALNRLLCDPHRLRIQPLAKLGELLLPAGEERLGLAVGGVVVINQSSELRSLLPQRDELGLLSLYSLVQANRGIGNLPPLVFAHCAQHVRVISIQRVPGDIGQLA
jgi:hypothetical protein